MPLYFRRAKKVLWYIKYFCEIDNVKLLAEKEFSEKF